MILAERKNMLSNKPQALTKSMNVGIWVVVAFSLPFVRNLEIVFSKTKVVSGKTLFFLISPFYAPRSICLNTGF